MLAHLEAVQAIVEPLGYAVYLVDVPKTPTYPYVLLWSSAGRLVAEAVCDEQSDLDDLLGVTQVGGTPQAALVVAEAVRGVLMDAAPAVAGWSSALRLFDSRAVEVDRDVTTPELNRHPSYAVDIYRYRSTPTPTPTAPVPPDGYTSVAAGTPGDFLPVGIAHPWDVQALRDDPSVGDAGPNRPASPWALGDYVGLANAGEAWWNGTFWQVGRGQGRDAEQEEGPT